MTTRNSSKQKCPKWRNRATHNIGLASTILITLFGLPSAMNAMTNVIQFVKVGNPGNPADARTGGTNGSVAYKYYIGKYPIRNDQWVEFLNSVIISTNDPHGLSIGHDQTRGGYTRSVSGSNYIFGLKANYE